MGGILAVGARFADGRQKSALMYTSDIQNLLLDSDVAAGNSDPVEKLIDLMESDAQFGPCPAAPYGFGLRFFDFVTATIFDSHSHFDPMGIDWLDVVSSKKARDGRFQKMIPFIKGMTQMIDVGGRFRVQKTSISPVEDEEQLWIALGFAGFPSKKDFLTLDMSWPFWKLKIFGSDVESQEIMKIEMEDRQILSRSDEIAWSRHLSKARQDYQRLLGWMD